mmetsp:Transcript_35154/g.105107  ORF Transcript_35154/g.105107 Transcript_35154/m.105107 type:complete len:306 (+) Transcript_35154:387-1304(+)
MDRRAQQGAPLPFERGCRSRFRREEHGQDTGVRLASRSEVFDGRFADDGLEVVLLRLKHSEAPALRDGQHALQGAVGRPHHFDEPRRQGDGWLPLAQGPGYGPLLARPGPAPHPALPGAALPCWASSWKKWVARSAILLVHPRELGRSGAHHERACVLHDRHEPRWARPVVVRRAVQAGHPRVLPPRRPRQHGLPRRQRLRRLLPRLPELPGRAPRLPRALAPALPALAPALQEGLRPARRALRAGGRLASCGQDHGDYRWHGQAQAALRQGGVPAGALADSPAVRAGKGISPRHRCADVGQIHV